MRSKVSIIVITLGVFTLAVLCYSLTRNSTDENSTFSTDAVIFIEDVIVTTECESVLQVNTLENESTFDYYQTVPSNEDVNLYESIEYNTSIEYSSEDICETETSVSIPNDDNLSQPETHENNKQLTEPSMDETSSYIESNSPVQGEYGIVLPDDEW